MPESIRLRSLPRSRQKLVHSWYKIWNPALTNLMCKFFKVTLREKLAHSVNYVQPRVQTRNSQPLPPD